MEKEIIADATALLKDGGVVGLLVFVVVITVGLVLRYKGFFTASDGASTQSSAGPEEMNKLSSRIGQMDARLTDVERDIQRLPTRDEMHEFELQLTRLDGRFGAMEDNTKATSRAVSRIEDFMIDVSKRNKG